MMEEALRILLQEQGQQGSLGESREAETVQKSPKFQGAGQAGSAAGHGEGSHHSCSLCSAPLWVFWAADLPGFTPTT